MYVTHTSDVNASPPPSQKYIILAFVILILLAVVALIVGLCVGLIKRPVWEVKPHLQHQPTEQTSVLLSINLPRLFTLHPSGLSEEARAESSAGNEDDYIKIRHVSPDSVALGMFHFCDFLCSRHPGMTRLLWLTGTSVRCHVWSCHFPPFAHHRRRVHPAVSSRRSRICNQTEDDWDGHQVPLQSEPPVAT